MLKLVIADKNYSSWSMRPAVLMRALGIALFPQDGSGIVSPDQIVAEVVKAARAVFAEMGYGAASVRDIVRHVEAWMTQGASARAW